MKARSSLAGNGAFAPLVALRWLLAAALTVTALVHVLMVSWTFRSVVGQAGSFYVVNAAIDGVPAVLYAAAVVLALSGRGGRLAWGVLFACGLALSAVALFYLATVGFSEFMIAPFCLVALSLLELQSRSRVAEAQ